MFTTLIRHSQKKKEDDGTHIHDGTITTQNVYSLSINDARLASSHER